MRAIYFILILGMPLLTWAQTQYAFNRYGTGNSTNNTTKTQSSNASNNATKLSIAEPDLTYNEEYSGNYSDKQDLEATALLYKEINYYRQLNGCESLTISERVVGYACRWANYMTYKHISPYNKFYEHSKYGPDSLHIPSSNTSEIIHCIYFEKKPTAVEAVSALMYGRVRTPECVIGWIGSESHKKNILQKVVKYYGASVFVFKTTNNWYCVFGVVNFSTIL